jgi:hypothetical protein
VRPWLSLVLVVTPVNKETQTLVNVMEKGMPCPVFSLCIKKTLNLYNPAQERYRRSCASKVHQNWPITERSVSIYI